MSHLMQKRFVGTRRKPRLTSNFATRLIETEQELDHRCTIDTINKLVSLYTEAIEFYSYQKDMKELDYQNRMHRMFLRPDVIQLIKNKTEPQVRPKPEEQKPHIERPMQHSSKSVNRVIDYQKLRNIEVAKKAVSDFKCQDSDLSKRLASRQKSMFSKSMDTSKNLSTTLYNEGHSMLDKICEEIESEKTDDYDLKLEKVMEASFAEKARRTVAVRVKYESQMSAFEGQGQLMEQVLERLKADMKSELAVVESECQEALKLEISNLRKQLI